MLMLFKMSIVITNIITFNTNVRVREEGGSIAHYDILEMGVYDQRFLCKFEINLIFSSFI